MPSSMTLVSTLVIVLSASLMMALPTMMFGDVRELATAVGRKTVTTASSLSLAVSVDERPDYAQDWP